MKKRHVIVLLSLVLLVSCGKLDFESLETGKPYFGHCQDKGCVLVVDQVEAGNLKGRVYLDEGDLVAQPLGFTSDLKDNGKGRLWIDDGEKRLAKVSLNKGSIKGTVDGNAFVLSLVPETDFSFKSQFKDPCFKVVMEQGRVYARNVRGYWTSYPETGEEFMTIYLRKSFDLVAKERLDLDMDIYYPATPPGEGRRPLLLLIHGGAFFNGDKQSVGYPEMARHFASRGYVVSSINYRLGFKPSADAVDCAGYRALQDAHAAVCYLIDNADEFGIDTTKIFAAGTSAGAITALNLAFMEEDNRPACTYHIGPINAVAGDHDRPFHVNAVVNMWGAVHDLSMINNSPGTSILSFHGDADHIVPYAFGYPFDGVFETPVDGIFDFFGTSVNEVVFNPMQGSKAIHDKAVAMGRRSELHTVEGGDHSLHVDCGRLSHYFYDTIIPNMTRFLYEEIVGGQAVRLDRDGAWFDVVGADHVAELHWRVDGGVVMACQGDARAKLLFFGDATEHSVTIGGKYRNGVEFNEKQSVY